MDKLFHFFTLLTYNLPLALPPRYCGLKQTINLTKLVARCRSLL